MKKYKLSKFCITTRKGNQIRVYHSYYGNISKLNYTAFKLLQFMKKPKTIEQINEKFNISTNELKRLEYLGFIITNSKKDKLTNIESNIKPYEHSTFRLYLTQRCNLACTYCFEEEKVKEEGRDMTYKMALMATKSYCKFYNSLKKKPFRIKFEIFGGEPLLNWKVVPKFFPAVDKLLRKTCSNISYGITTNGTLFTQDICDFLIKHNFRILISLDGLQGQHDAIRRFSSGGGTFNKVKGGIEMLLRLSSKKYIRENVGITSTVGTHNIKGLSRFLKFISSYSIKNVSFNKVASCGGISSGDYKQLKTEDKNFKEKMKKIYDLSDKYSINVGGMWGHIRNRFMNGGVVFCSAVGLEFGVDPNGDVYPCPFVFGNKKYAVAKITKDGYTLLKYRYDLWANRFVTRIKECRNCNIAGICRGGCLGMALFSDKKKVNAPFGCEYAKEFSDWFL